MNEQAVSAKRFVSVSEYQRLTGLGYKAVKHMIRTKQVPYIETECGKYKVDTSPINGTSDSEVMDKLNELQRQVYALCKQFNTDI